MSHDLQLLNTDIWVA